MKKFGILLMFVGFFLSNDWAQVPLSFDRINLDLFDSTVKKEFNEKAFSSIQNLDAYLDFFFTKLELSPHKQLIESSSSTDQVIAYYYLLDKGVEYCKVELRPILRFYVFAEFWIEFLSKPDSDLQRPALVETGSILASKVNIDYASAVVKDLNNSTKDSDLVYSRLTQDSYYKKYDTRLYESYLPLFLFSQTKNLKNVGDPKYLFDKSLEVLGGLKVYLGAVSELARFFDSPVEDSDRLRAYILKSLLDFATLIDPKMFKQVIDSQGMLEFVRDGGAFVSLVICTSQESFTSKFNDKILKVLADKCFKLLVAREYYRSSVGYFMINQDLLNEFYRFRDRAYGSKYSYEVFCIISNMRNSPELRDLVFELKGHFEDQSKTIVDRALNFYVFGTRYLETNLINPKDLSELSKEHFEIFAGLMLVDSQDPRPDLLGTVSKISSFQLMSGFPMEQAFTLISLNYPLGLFTTEYLVRLQNELHEATNSSNTLANIDFGGPEYRNYSKRISRYFFDLIRGADNDFGNPKITDTIGRNALYFFKDPDFWSLFEAGATIKNYLGELDNSEAFSKRGFKFVHTSLSCYQYLEYPFFRDEIDRSSIKDLVQKVMTFSDWDSIFQRIDDGWQATRASQIMEEMCNYLDVMDANQIYNLIQRLPQKAWGLKKKQFKLVFNKVLPNGISLLADTYARTIYNQDFRFRFLYEFVLGNENLRFASDGGILVDALLDSDLYASPMGKSAQLIIQVFSARKDVNLSNVDLARSGYLERICDLMVQNNISSPLIKVLDKMQFNWMQLVIANPQKQGVLTKLLQREKINLPKSNRFQTNMNYLIDEFGYK